MKDIDIIYEKCKKAHYKGWNEDDIEICKNLLLNLSLEQLRMLNKSRWMSKKSPIYPTLFSLLYKEHLDDVVKKLNKMSNEELIREIKETKSSFKKDKIPHILCERFDGADGKERKKMLDVIVKHGLEDMLISY